MKKFLTMLAVLTVTATPAFAQSFSVSLYGTGNVEPGFTLSPWFRVPAWFVGHAGSHTLWG